MAQLLYINVGALLWQYYMQCNKLSVVVGSTELKCTVRISLRRDFYNDRNLSEMQGIKEDFQKQLIDIIKNYPI